MQNSNLRKGDEQLNVCLSTVLLFRVCERGYSVCALCSCLIPVWALMVEKGSKLIVS